MTKTEASSAYGQRLIHQILAISHDGDLTVDEVRVLHAVLVDGPPEMAAVEFLRHSTTQILNDGILDEAEMYALRRDMERVVPKAIRVTLSELLSKIGLPTSTDEDGDDSTFGSWKRDPITSKQLSFIRDLGGAANERMTKGEASRIIDELLERRPPSPRQMMVLRFFDRLDLRTRTKEEVSVWLDDLYIKDERYERAWHRYKLEVGDDGTSRDPASVPIGAYRKYLSRAPSTRHSSESTVNPNVRDMEEGTPQQPISPSEPKNASIMSHRGRLMIVGSSLLLIAYALWHVMR